MIVGVSVGLTPAQLQPWAASARKHWGGRIVLLAQDPPLYEGLAKTYQLELRTAWLKRDHDPCGVYKYRWEELASFLYRETRNEPVLFTDTRDVVFQREPFYPGTGLYVATEGRTFTTCDWNRERMQLWFKDQYDRSKDWLTYCAGVVQAPASALHDFARIISKNLGSRSGEADQAAFNLVARDMGAVAVPYREGWTCHLAQMSPLSRCYAPGSRAEETPQLLMPAGEFINSSGEPFKIVHHWPYCPRLRWTEHGFQEKARHTQA